MAGARKNLLFVGGGIGFAAAVAYTYRFTDAFADAKEQENIRQLGSRTRDDALQEMTKAQAESERLHKSVMEKRNLAYVLAYDEVQRATERGVKGVKKNIHSANTWPSYMTEKFILRSAERARVEKELREIQDQKYRELEEKEKELGYKKISRGKDLASSDVSKGNAYRGTISAK